MNQTEHIMSCLGEEAAEIAQDASKANRFGLLDVNYREPLGPTNQRRLINELNDLLGTVRLLVMIGELPSDWEDGGAQLAKMQKIARNMEYAERVGALKRTPLERDLIPETWRVLPVPCK